MSFRARIDDVTRFRPEAYRPFIVAGHTVGRVAHRFADEALSGFADVFQVTPEAVAVNPALETPAARTAAAAAALDDLNARGMIAGWRGEPYPVTTGFYDAPLMTIERAAAVLFGTMAYGVNLNGYFRKGDDIHLWVARRSDSKPVAPGKLDHTVAGGQPVGISIRDNLVKECWEEAGIPAELAGAAVPVGTLSYLTERPHGLRHSLFFNFDLELPRTFQPVATDGEVQDFALWPIGEVLARMRATDDFKFDVPLGLLDFAVRHGALGPDDPEYIYVCEALRLGLAAPVPAR